MTVAGPDSSLLLETGPSPGLPTDGVHTGAELIAMARVARLALVPARCAGKTLADALDRQALLDSVTGRPEAFARLVDRHSRRCLAEARRVLIDEHLAQDSVQEAYLDLWRHASRHDPEQSAVGPWLVMLTHRRAVDRVRKEQGHPWPIATVPDVTDDVDLQEQAERNLLGRRAADLLRELPEPQRRCLVLAYWGGNTMTEIAALTGVPTGTVKTRCRAALRKLRELTAQQNLTP